jgi:hypothetical protein
MGIRHVQRVTLTAIQADSIVDYILKDVQQ